MPGGPSAFMGELVPNSVAECAGEQRDSDRQRIGRRGSRRQAAVNDFRRQGKERCFQISLKNRKAKPSGGQTKQEKTGPCMSKIVLRNAGNEVKKIRSHTANDQGGQHAITAKRKDRGGM